MVDHKKTLGAEMHLLKHGKWTKEEDECLRASIRINGEKHWRLISEGVPGRSPIQCLHRWSKILKPGLVKGPWSPGEDKALRTWVREFGPMRWSECASLISGRSGKQCRERWYNTLNPAIKKGQWTPEEDKVIFELQAAIGPKWTEIAKQLPGRTENSIKNRFYSTVRRLKTTFQAEEIDFIVDTRQSAVKSESVSSTADDSEYLNQDTRLISLVEQMKSLENLMAGARSEISLFERII